MRLVLLATAAAALFVSVTGRSLPDTVASRFDASGVADSFMSRGGYLTVMLAIVILLPLIMAFASRWIARLPEDAINIPNKAYWLSPERRSGSLAFISAWLQWCSVGVAAFLCYVHWLVVRGNAMTPPRLENGLLYGSLAVAAVALGIGVVALIARFRRVA